MNGREGSFAAVEVAALEFGGAEVDEESVVQAKGVEIVDGLCQVGGGKSGDGFEFDEYAVDNHIGHIFAEDKAVFVVDGNGDLGLDGEAGLFQPVGQSGFVNIFEKSGSEVGMEVKCGLADDIAELFGLFFRYGILFFHLFVLLCKNIIRRGGRGQG